MVWLTLEDRKLLTGAASEPTCILATSVLSLVVPSYNRPM